MLKNLKRFALAAGVSLAAATAYAVNWPAAVSGDSNLLKAANNCYSTLSTGISASSTTISVANAGCFNSTTMPGVITIEAEVIYYSSRSATQFFTCTRGYDGTTGTSHSSGKTVYMAVVASFHNGLRDELIGMSTFFMQGTTLRISTTNARVGLSTGTPQATLDVRGNAAFGSTAQSTFTTAGALQMPNNVTISMNNGSSQVSMVQMTGGGNSVFGDSSVSNLISLNNSALTVALSTNGKMGVGLNTPTHVLHVLGGGLITSSLTVQTGLYVSGGNVGISTGNPQSLLDVAGVIRATGTVFNTVNYKWPGADGSSGQQLTTDGAGQLSWAAAGSGGGGTPGGSDTQVQFNDGGSFGGDAGFLYNKTADALTLVGTMTVQGNAFSVGSATFNVTQGKVGIGTDTPTAFVDMLAPDTPSFGGQYLLLRTADTDDILSVVLRATGTEQDLTIAVHSPNAVANAKKAVLTAGSQLGGILFNVGGTNALFISSTSGRVGIGTTSPTTLLEIAGTATATQFSGSGAGLTSIPAANLTGTVPNASIDGSSITKLGPTIDASELPSDGYAATYVNTTGDTMTGQLTVSGATLTVTGNAFSVGTSTLVVSSGLVGIGTGTPTALLNIQGGAGGSPLVIINSTDSLPSISLRENGSATLSLQSASGVSIIGANSSGGLRLRGDGSNDHVQLLNGGNLGINDTTPDGLLDIKSNASPTGNILSISSQSDTTGDIFSILGNGKVGIGVASPQNVLDVRGASSFGSTAQSTFTTAGALQMPNNVTISMNNGSSQVSMVQMTGGGNAVFGDSSVANLISINNSAGTVALSAAGKFGVGLNAPTHLLHVNGGALVTSSATIQGGVYPTDLTASYFVKTDANKKLVSQSSVSLSTEVDGTLQAAQFPALTGDVTTPAGSLATTIADNSVDGTDIAFGSDAQGDVYYYDGTNVVRLPAGNSGEFLKTQGTGANPVWAAASGGSSTLAVATGSASAFTGTVSSPTAVLNFDSSLFTGQPTGSATAYISLDADLADLADGSLTGSKIGDGVPAANIAAGTLDSDVMASSATQSLFYNHPTVRSNLGLAIGTNVQAWDADLDDLADGSLTGSKIGSGVPAANIASGSLGASVIASSVAHQSVNPSALNSTDSPADGEIPSYDSGTGEFEWIAASGSGDAVLAATQTFSGFNTFTSSNGVSITYGAALGSATVNDLSASQFVKTDSNKKLTSQASVSLTSEVSGTLPIANGGTARTSKPIRHYPIEIVSSSPTATNGASLAKSSETATNKVNWDYMEFIDGTTTYVYFGFDVPSGFDGSTITWTAVWASTAGTTTSSVTWCVDAVSLSDSDSLDTAYGTAVCTSDAIGSLNTARKTATSSALTIGNTWTAGDLVQWRFYRKVDDASDTVASTVRALKLTMSVQSAYSDE